MTRLDIKYITYKNAIRLIHDVIFRKDLDDLEKLYFIHSMTNLYLKTLSMQKRKGGVLRKWTH